MAAPRRLGVLLNRFGGRDRRALRQLRAALVEAGERVDVHESESARRCGDGLEALLRDDVAAIAIAGGDGTLHHAISYLLNRPGEEVLPPLAILPTGTTNVTARDIGTATSATRELRAILARIAAGNLTGGLVSRRAMAVQVGDEAVPRYGLMAGAGGIYQGTVIIRRHLRRLGARGTLGPIAGMARMIAPLLIGRSTIDPVSAAIVVDGAALPAARYIAVLLSSLHDLSPGVRPFWGGGPGGVRMTLVRESPRFFARALWPALRGRSSGVATPSNGYVSLNADTIEIRMSGGFVLDGEILELTEEQPLRVTSGPDLLFVRG